MGGRQPRCSSVGKAADTLRFLTGPSLDTSHRLDSFRPRIPQGAEGTRMFTGDPRQGVRRIPRGGPLVVAILLATAAGCYPSGVETINDLNTVTTVHDGGVNFASFTTFAVADQVKFLEADGGSNPLPPALGDPLINEVI